MRNKNHRQQRAEHPYQQQQPYQPTNQSRQPTCVRCGNTGHVIDNCYAKRNRNGVPLPHNGVHKPQQPQSSNAHQANVSAQYANVSAQYLSTEFVPVQTPHDERYDHDDVSSFFVNRDIASEPVHKYQNREASEPTRKVYFDDRDTSESTSQYEQYQNREVPEPTRRTYQDNREVPEPTGHRQNHETAESTSRQTNYPNSSHRTVKSVITIPATREVSLLFTKFIFITSLYLIFLCLASLIKCASALSSSQEERLNFLEIIVRDYLIYFAIVLDHLTVYWKRISVRVSGELCLYPECNRCRI
jgi:hypothetical protein